MNYYSFHVGDYLSATAHLDLEEEAIYMRLLNLYYQTEQPIPNDPTAICRQIRARGKEELLIAILAEFFTLDGEHWIHSRCERELEAFREKESRADAVREAEKERQERHRARRKELFDQLREHGVVPEWDTPTNELVTHLSRVTGRTGHATCHAPDTAIAKNQEPITNNHKPVEKERETRSRGSRLPADWSLPDDWGEWARQERPDIDVRAVADGFADYWRSAAGSKGVKADWAATWRNWVRNQRAPPVKAAAKSAGERNAAFLDEWTGGLASARPAKKRDEDEPAKRLSLIPR